MNILGDIRMEARSVAATNAAADATGGLIGPPLKPKGSYDDDGLLIDYRRKCLHTDCDVNLTNRTRYDGKNLCIEHGREHERERLRLRRRARGAPTRAEMAATASASASVAEAAPKAAPRVAVPVRHGLPDAIAGLPILPKSLQKALVAWLEAPGEIHTDVNLKTAMLDYELNARLRRVIPPAMPLAPIPVEDPGDALTNPDRRSTRSEFLADAGFYGA